MKRFIIAIAAILILSGISVFAFNSVEAQTPGAPDWSDNAIVTEYIWGGGHHLRDVNDPNFSIPNNVKYHVNLQTPYTTGTSINWNFNLDGPNPVNDACNGDGKRQKFSLFGFAEEFGLSHSDGVITGQLEIPMFEDGSYKYDPPTVDGRVSTWRVPIGFWRIKNNDNCRVRLLYIVQVQYTDTSPEPTAIPYVAPTPTATPPPAPVADPTHNCSLGSGNHGDPVTYPNWPDQLPKTLYRSTTPYEYSRLINGRTWVSVYQGWHRHNSGPTAGQGCHNH